METGKKKHTRGQPEHVSVCVEGAEVGGNTTQARGKKKRRQKGLHQFPESLGNHAKKVGHNFCKQIDVMEGFFWQRIIISALASS